MKLTATAKILLAALATLFVICVPLLADIDDTPIVVIREDDCCANLRYTYTGLGGISPLAYLKQKRIPITFAVITNLADAKDPRSLTWAELLDYYYSVGCELASHSASHATMTTTQQYIDELTKSRAAIEARIPGYQCTTFIQPGVWKDDADLCTFARLTNPIGLALQSTYQQSQGYIESDWRIGTPYYKYGRAVSYTVDYSSTFSLSKSLALLDLVAQTPGLVYVVTFHGAQETGGTAQYCVPADVMKAYFARLADLRDQGKVRLLTMNEAYHAQHSPNLNCVADPGFDLSQPEFGNDGPWQATSPAGYYVNTGGVNNSRYAVTAGWGMNGEVPLGPGRYRMSWSQRPEAGTPQSTALATGFLSYTPEGTRYDRCSFPTYRNTNVNVWERHSVLFKMDYGIAKGFIQFAPSGNGAYGMDDVSVVAEPIDPAVSPSSTSGTISPSGLDLNWYTPGDSSVTSICIRCDSKTNPMTPTSGSAWKTIPAQPATWQHWSATNVNWASQNYWFFSVFAVRADGTYSPPDLFDVRVDKAGPNTPIVAVTTGSNRSISASWSAADTDLQSGVYSYAYGVGTSPGQDDVVHLTSTTSTNVSLTVPACTKDPLYVWVKAQNLYGYWSGCGYQQLSLGPRPATLGVETPDGSVITVQGTVTAVLSDCMYITDAKRTRGLRVEGASGYHEGDSATVTGIMSTNRGERVLTLGRQ